MAAPGTARLRAAPLSCLPCLPQVAEQCAASCEAIACDVADAASIQALSATVRERHPGGLDALMIVAGVAAEKQDILTGGCLP